MKTKFLISALLLLISSSVFAQQVIPLSAPPPPPVSVVTAIPQAPLGNHTHCYWIVAIYPIGQVLGTNPGCTSRANLQGGGTVTINWNNVPAATGYNVLRTSGTGATTFPASGTCTNCLVASNVSGGPVTDSTSALSSFTVLNTNPAAASLSLDNQDYSTPRILLAPYQVGGFSGLVYLDGTVQTTANITGSGTVTNIATSGLIQGGPITGTGTISCPACVGSSQSNTYTGGGMQSMAGTDLIFPTHATDPATCTAGQVEFNSGGPTFKGCSSTNTWAPLGLGTVTSFSAQSALSPLFTTSVSNPSTTPNLSFLLSNFSADNIFGNFTGSSAAPSTQQIPACANDGAHALVYVSHALTCESVTVGGLSDPGSNGIVYRNGLNTTQVAVAANFPTLNQSTTGNAATATALAATPSVWNVTTGFTIGGAAASGNYLRGNGTDFLSSAIQVADVPTLNQSTTGNAATATALAATPTLCSTGNAPTGILANGNATGCASIGGSGLPTLPTTPNGIPQTVTSTPSGGVGGPAQWSIPGVPVVTESTTPVNPLPITVDVSLVNNTNAGATAWTGFALANNYAFAILNNGGAITYTPASGTVNGASTQLIPPNYFGFHYTDNTNTYMPVLPTIAAFPNCTGTNVLAFASATGLFSCTSIAQSFSAITAGTNTNALLVGSGGSLTISGSGTINATSIGGITITGTPSVGYVPTATSASAATWQASSSGSAFSAITSATNTTAAMIVGSGASLTISGTGTINATSIAGITVSGTPSTGQVLTATSSSAANWQAATAGTIAFPATVTGCVAGGVVYGSSGTTQINCAAAIATNAIVKGNGASGVTAASLNINGLILEASTTTGAVSVQGGQDSSANSALGPLHLGGANQTGAGGSSSQGGAAWLYSGVNAATNTGTVSGSLELSVGGSYGATNTGLQGLMIFTQTYKQSGTVTQWNGECFDSTAKNVSDCGASPSNVAGVAFSLSGAIQVNVAVAPSEVPINASAAVTVGHTVCWGTTAGQVTDSGGNGPCLTGMTAGTVIAITGAYGGVGATFPDGTAFPTISSTLPLVRLERHLGIGNGDAASLTAINGLNITASTGTLTIANGKTVTVNNTLTFTGTDSSSVAFGAGGTVRYNVAIPFDTAANDLTTPTADASFTFPNTASNGLTLNGTPPASSAGTGTNAMAVLTINGVTGGATSGASLTAGTGSSPTITAGAGGAATAGNGNGGAGGSITLAPGLGGSKSGSGTAGANGSIFLIAAGVFTVNHTNSINNAIANSPIIALNGTFEATSGPTYNTDSWTIQGVIGAGVNGTSTLTFSHSGSSGTAAVSLPAITTGTLSASGQITSTVSTGTAPLVIASTTQVTNLNAATLGGINLGTPVAGGIGYGVSATQIGTTAAGTAKQVVLSGGTGAPTMIDFPERLMIPAANCNNATAGAGWSIGSGGTVTCRAGTNNLGGYVSITDTASTFAQFQLSIPVDWDTATDPYILFGLISVTDTTNGHTIIPQIKVSCPTAINGTVTDDHAFAAAHSATTITFGGSAVANGFYTTSVQMNSTDMSGCVAGGFMIVQVGRATDTATGTIGFEYANVTFPRLIAVQAN